MLGDHKKQLIPMTSLFRCHIDIIYYYYLLFIFSIFIIFINGYRLISYVFFFEGAVPRLWETRRRVDKFSFTLESTIMYGFIKLCLLLFPLSVVRRLINYLLNKVSCTVTRIPGPNMPVYLNGKMTKMMACWTPRKTQNGFSVSITNHSGQIYVGLVTKPSQMNDPSLLLAEFEREVADLGNHLGKRALPSHLRWRLKVDQQLVNAVNEEREREAAENDLV